jgi:hypothetical protein
LQALSLALNVNNVENKIFERDYDEPNKFAIWEKYEAIIITTSN